MIRPRSAECRARACRRGMTLLEAMVAVMVLAVGLVGLFGLIEGVQDAHRRSQFDAIALDAFAQLSAQIADAQCDFPASAPGTLGLATVDPGLAPTGGAWIGFPNPVLGSTVVATGDLVDTSVRTRIEYRVLDATLPGAAPKLDIDVRIRQLLGDGATGPDDPNLEDGYWIRVYPLEKVCVPRLLPPGIVAGAIDGTVGRGEY